MRLAPLCLLLAVFPFVSCERRNPEYCDDTDLELHCPQGSHCDPTHRCAKDVVIPTCTNSQSCASDAKPVCDPNTLHCRSCFSGEDALCAEHNSSTPRCLGASQMCVQCLTPGAVSMETPDCATVGTQLGATPVCDAGSHMCRGCQYHYECGSGACVKASLADGALAGKCVPPDQVLIVDPGQACAPAGPIYCTPAQALVHLDATHRYIIIKKSVMAMDFSEIEIGTRVLNIYFIGPLADGPPTKLMANPPVLIGAPARRGFIVDKRCKVTVEGFYIAGGRVGVQCSGDGVGDNDTQVRIVRSVISGNDVAVSAHDSCRMLMTESWVGKQQAASKIPPAGNRQSFDLSGTDFAISNTVIVGNSDEMNGIFGGIEIDGLGGGAGATTVSSIVNSLFYQQDDDHLGATSIVCDKLLDKNRLVVLNSLFLQPPDHPPGDQFISPACGATLLNLGTDDPALAMASPSNVKIDRGTGPGFVDAVGRDFHLQKNGATAQKLFNGGLVSYLVNGQSIVPTVDLDNDPSRPRPQSGHVAIGPYEPGP